MVVIDMPINLALSGATGRVGKAIIDLLQLDPRFLLQLALTRGSSVNQTHFIDKSVEVLIDFSTPSSCIEYLKICAQLQIPAVIGTTGFNEDQLQQIDIIAEAIPVLLSPNFSLGISICKNLLQILAKLWAKYHSGAISIMIDEIHHQYKKDSPSGTALMIAGLLQQQLEQLNANIKINSKRVGRVKGIHSISFANDLEEIKLIHKVKQRSIFAQGALLAAGWLAEHRSSLKPKVYNFSDLLNI